MPDRSIATLTIDVGAIVQNWKTIAALVGPKVETAAVVKADSYGLGAATIAPALQRAGCRTFFAATIDEGIALRALLPGARILVLCGPLPGTAEDLAAHDLIPVLNSLDQVERWRGRGEAALHLDTGMNRLGMTAADLDRVDLSGLDVALVMSHMACADEPAHGKNAEQLAAFRALAARIPGNAPRSLAASSTVFLGPEHHFDLVRPGLALYGGNPVPGKPNPMAPAVQLSAKILQVRDVDTPMTVGYGATHRFRGKARIATAALGYADGLFRSLGNRGFGVIEGVRVPVVGRISMDLTTFDVTDAPAHAVREGAMIELIGPGHSLEELAEEAGTIGYEVLTALGARHTRIYKGAA